MYPSDDALIIAAPLVTALEASTQPSEPIRQRQSTAVCTAASVTATEHIWQISISYQQIRSMQREYTYIGWLK